MRGMVAYAGSRAAGGPGTPRLGGFRSEVVRNRLGMRERRRAAAVACAEGGVTVAASNDDVRMLSAAMEAHASDGSVAELLGKPESRANTCDSVDVAGTLQGSLV